VNSCNHLSFQSKSVKLLWPYSFFFLLGNSKINMLRMDENGHNHISLSFSDVCKIEEKDDHLSYHLLSQYHHGHQTNKDLMQHPCR
jgi:hypothetical protein